MKATKHPITLLALFFTTMVAAAAIMTSAPTPTGAYDAPTGSTSNERLQQSDTPPAPPTGITLVGVTHDSVTISWTAPDHDDIRHFLILRRNPAEQDAGVFIEAGTTSDGTVTTFTDNSLEPETRYVYRVKTVYDDDDVSKWSSFINATTSEAPPPPTPEPTPEATPEPTPQPEHQRPVDTNDGTVLTEPLDSDFPASTDTTAIIGRNSVAQTIIGTISESGDVDWIKLENNGHQTYRVYLTGYSGGDHSAGSPRFNPLLSADGVAVHEDDPMKPPRGEQWTHYTAFPSGDIYFPVVDQLGTGSYRVTAVLDSEWEHSRHGTVDFPADTSTTGFLNWHSMGKMAPDDVDWFELELSSGTRYRIHVEPSPHTRLDRRTEVRLLDADGDPVPGASAVHEFNFSPCQAGTNTFYVEVSDPNPVDDRVNEYTIWRDTLGPTQNPTRGSVLGPTEARVQWSCFAGADSHKLEYYRDGAWETVGTYNLPTKSANAVNLSETSNTWEFRTTAINDGGDGASRRLTVKRTPPAPSIHTSTWRLERGHTGTTVRWDPVAGASQGYLIEVYDYADEEWKSLLAPSGLPHLSHERSDHEVVFRHVSARYLTEAAGGQNEQIKVRVAAVNRATSSPWSEQLVAQPNKAATVATNGSAVLNTPYSATISYTFPEFSNHGCYRDYQYRGTEVAMLQDGHWVTLGGTHSGITSIDTTQTQSVITGIESTENRLQFRVRQYGTASCSGTTSATLVSRWSEPINVIRGMEQPRMTNGSTNAAGSATLEWTQVENAVSYSLKVWNGTGWLGLSEEHATTSATVTGLDNTLYWYIFEVIAESEDINVKSPWSKPIAIFNTHRTSKAG